MDVKALSVLWKWYFVFVHYELAFFPDLCLPGMLLSVYN